MTERITTQPDDVERASILGRPAAVICDMDGLLVDSERMERRVWQLVAKELDIELTDERFATFVGHSGDRNDALLRHYFGEDFDVPRFRAMCHRGFRELVESEGVAMRPGAREWLAFVSELRIPLGLATSSGPAAVQERLGDVLHRFAAVATRADVEHGKPHPDLYLEAAKRLGIAPETAVAIEDSPAGTQAALAAGMRVVVIPDLIEPPPDLAPQLAAVFPSLDALREAVAPNWSSAEVSSTRSLNGSTSTG
jgi:HAD superfamily hydrolase (TIGR01509 family)